jgi:GNAT superfamily N-acetyltransferase
MIDVKVVLPEELKQVRFEVLWPYMNSASEADIDIDNSIGAIHLGGIIDGKIVGCASLFIQQCDRYPSFFKYQNIYRLRAMGVLESVQGKGVGAAILNKAEGICRDKGVNVIWCDSREVAWDFYLKQGYKCYSQTGFG